jgi:hypothetical protein
VLIDFCPIAQNFEFTLDDPAGHGTRADGATPVANKQYFDALQAWRQRFDGPISIYSYYRRYAWDSLPVVLPWHMKREMAWYGSIPTQGISSYSEPGDWFAYELNHYLLPALAWDRDQDADALVKKFADARYGDAAPVAINTYKILADVVRKDCSVPFVSLKSEAEIDVASKRESTPSRQSSPRPVASRTQPALARLTLVVEYVHRDLAVQKMRATDAPRDQIRERSRRRSQVALRSRRGRHLPRQRQRAHAQPRVRAVWRERQVIRRPLPPSDLARERASNAS